MDIKVTTENVVIDQESLNKGEYNIRECNFDLANEFIGLVCKALFTVRETNLTYQQDIVNSKCTIPYEATEQKGIVEVGVIAYEIDDEELIKRYSPAPDVFFVIDGSYVEDIENQSTPTPSELEQLEQRVSAIEIDAEQVEINTQNISDLQENKADKTELEDFITKDVNDLTYYTLTTQTGSQIELSLNSTNFKMTATLKDKNGIVVNTSNEIDLPLESVVVNASYDSSTKELVLTLQNGTTVRVSIADLVSGLVSDTDYATSNKGGVIKVNDYYKATSVTNTGALQAETKTYAQYNTMDNSAFIGKGTLENVITGKQLVNETQLNTKADKSSLVTGSGTEVTLQNTAELEFIQPPLPRGNSEQVQYSGKNLAGPIQGSDEAEGVTIQVNGNTISFTGTTTDASTFRFIGNSVVRIARYFQAQTIQEGSSIKITPGTYILNYDGATVLAFYGDLGDTLNNSTAISKNTPFTITEDKYVWLGRYVANATQTNDTISNIQLEKSSTATSYEPYCGGTASPNPSYPQSISNVTGDVEVKIQNKNIFDVTEFDGITENSNGTFKTTKYYLDTTEVTFRGTANSQYTISFRENETLNSTGFSLTVNGTWINLANNGHKYTFTTDSNGETKLKLGAGSYALIGTSDRYIQIEANSTASTYVAHEEQTFTFPLGTQRMFLGDYLADDGIHHVRGQVVLDGSETWNQRTNSAGNKQFYCNTNATNVVMNNQLCNYAKFSSSVFNWGGIGSFGLLDNTHGFYLTVNNELELNTFKTAIATNNIIAEYPLAEEEIEAYTTEQQTAYNQIKQALSYNEQTNISGVSDEANPIFSVEAVQYKEPDVWTVAYVNTQIGRAIGGAY